MADLEDEELLLREIDQKLAARRAEHEAKEKQRIENILEARRASLIRGEDSSSAYYCDWCIECKRAVLRRQHPPHYRY
jgi:hypothetical protein